MEDSRCLIRFIDRAAYNFLWKGRKSLWNAESISIPISQITPYIDWLCHFVLRTAAKYIVDLPNRQRRLCLVGIDGLIFFGAIYLAIALRFDFLLASVQFGHYSQSIVFLVMFKLCCFYCAGIYRPLLRYSGISLIENALKATLISEISLILLNTWFAFTPLPRSVQVVSGLVGFLAVVFSRLVLRQSIRKIDLLTFRYKHQQQTASKSPQRLKAHTGVVIYGAGQAGMLLADALERDHQHHVVGFIDDNPSLVGREIGTVSIYPSSELTSLVLVQDVHLILLAIPSAPPTQRQQILTRLSLLAVEVRTVPTLEEIMAQKVAIDQTREIDVADLLGREEVQPVLALLQANVRGKVVLVTGAGGSIGAELCRQIVQQQPRMIVLYEVSEFALYSIELELAEANLQLQVVPYLGSITDADLLRKAITDNQVETIYHAAAYKHVPLVEANPVQGVLNNVHGTLTAAQVANECKVNTFVLISTDKAVRPTNVMGATKRIAELILQAMAAKPNIHTRFAMVRFGNVLGSSGSVVPRFRKQIADRLPITITHPDITRYFMSIPEAARLVIQAGAMGQGGEVFLLNMGDPVRIYDLAVQMIELSGLQPGKDIDIQITGLRPGEKLYEELLIDQANAIKTDHPKIYAAREFMMPWLELEGHLNQLLTIAQANDVSAIRPMLRKLVPEYQPAKHSARLKSAIAPTMVKRFLPPTAHEIVNA
jgi:FlaA1/EpsC-like NDP-sugar epimerase